MASSISSAPGGPGDFSVLILDTVTTGVKSDGGEIIEIAAALFSVQYRTVVSQISSLLPLSRPSNSAVKVNQIPVGAALSVKMHQSETLCQILLAWAQEAKYIVAHNAEHVRKWLADHWLLAPLCQRVWLCSCYDFIWPRQQRPGMNLVHLALAHGIGVTCANRATATCQLIASLMSHNGDALLEMITRAARPKCRVLAKVHYLARDKAHNAGFKWDAATRVWSRWMAIEDLPSLPVKYTVVEVDPRGNESVIWARLWQMYISHKAGSGDMEHTLAFEELGHRLWQCVRENVALLAGVQRLWMESERGGVEPKALLESFSAMEIWYWTAKHPLVAARKSTLNARSHCVYNLPEALGSESGDATSQSDDTCDQVSSVESVVEKVAESCLEPEDRQGSFSPLLIPSGAASALSD